jgi:hypothetical protein
VLSVEGRPCVRGDVERADDLPGVWIEGVQPVAGGEPHPLPVEADAVHGRHASEGTVFAKNLGGCIFHTGSLRLPQGGRE